MRFAASLAAAVALSGCTMGMRYSTVTDWPGSGYGRVETRIDRGPARCCGAMMERGVTVVPIGGVFVPIPVQPIGVNPWTTPALSHYEIRSPDGTLHIISDEKAFPEGACVAWTGYADSPARTHWSWGRVELQASDKCGG
jgi:hypothetical protein